MYKHGWSRFGTFIFNDQCNFLLLLLVVGQDRFIMRLFNHKKTKYYADIGAGNGILGSNTKLLESCLSSWKGVCFETDTQLYTALRGQRKRCKTFFNCLGNKVEKKRVPLLQTTSNGNRFFKNVTRECVPLQGVTTSLGVHRVDYVSIRSLGRELEIIEGMHLDKLPVSAISVQMHLDDEQVDENDEAAVAKRTAIHKTLTSFGYKYILTMGADDFFVKKSVFTDKQIQKAIPSIDESFHDGDDDGAAAPKKKQTKKKGGEEQKKNKKQKK